MSQDQQQLPGRNTSLATRSEEEIQQLEKLDSLIKGVGDGASTNSIRIAGGFMKWALEGNAHLISPATAPPSIPLGFEFAFSRVSVSGDTTKGEVYKTEGGKLAIHKNGLEKLAKAAGVVWDMKQCGRTDDMKEPNFAAYRVVGHYRDLDGSVMPIFGEKQMDLREGSERARSMKLGDLAQQRKFIAEHAETKAKLRAIRSLGIKSGYSEEELKLPFVVVKLAFNGRTSVEDDPDRSIQKAYSLMIAEGAVGGKNLLYGAIPGPELKDITPVPPETTAPLTAASVKEPEQPAEPQFCTAEMCYGEQSDGHIKACRGKVPGEVTEQKQEPPVPWVIPEGAGPKAGFKINDTVNVTDQDLSSLVGRYDFQLEGLEKDSMPAHLLRAYLKHVWDEIDRRKTVTQ